MIEVSDKRFAVVDMNSIPDVDFFAAVRDFDAVAAILRESELGKISPLKAETGFRLITFRTTLPFDTVGLIAKLSSALAQEGIPTLVLSSFSTDHILVKEEHLSRAVEIPEKVI